MTFSNQDKHQVSQNLLWLSIDKGKVPIGIREINGMFTHISETSVFPTVKIYHYSKILHQVTAR